MKIITILSLCLTASLSFANSEILDKTKDDAFTYNDSGLCDGIPNCYSSMKNFPEIDDNSRFPPMPTRIDNSTICSSPSWSNFNFFVAGISENDDSTQHVNKTKGNAISYDYSNIYEIEPSLFSLDVLYDTIYGLNIPFQHSDRPISIHTNMFITEPNFHLDYAKKIIRKLKSSNNKYGFRSKADANAYLNILDPIPSPQISSLGNSRSIIFDFNISINHNASIIEIQQNQYMLGFGAKKIKRLGQLTNPEILNIFTAQQLQDSKDRPSLAQPYVLLPEIFKVSKETTTILTEENLHITRTSCSASANEFHRCSHYPKQFMNITQEPNNQPIFGRRFTLLYEHANKEICPQVFKLNFIYLIPIQTSSRIYAQTNPNGNYSIVNQNENEEQAFICPKIPDEIRSIADLEKKHGCQQVQLAPSSSIEIKLKE